MAVGRLGHTDPEQQYRGWDEYPETGIEDHEFPHETSRQLGSLVLMPVRQMIYPLRRIGRELKKPRMD